MPLADVILVSDGVPLGLLDGAEPEARLCIVAPSRIASLAEVGLKPRLILVLLTEDDPPCPRMRQLLTRLWPMAPVLAVSEARRPPADAAMAAGFGGVLDAISSRRLIAALGLPPVERRTTSATDLPAMVGQSSAMRSVWGRLERYAAGDANLLITGETGTGKDLVARHAHALSRRRTQPFVALNCAALPDNLIESELFGYEKGAFTGAQQAYKGKIRLADGGTLFLDEIGDMPLGVQARILRVIENREVFGLGANRAVNVDIRLIAATNQALERRVACGGFREDLFYRLNVARLTLPPLRERRDDLNALIAHFLLSRPGTTLAPAARQRLLRHDWPGNVRELKNALEVALINVRRGRVELADLPDYLQAADAKCDLDDRQQLIAALQACAGNKSEAAVRLHCSRMTLYRKLAKYGLDEESVHGR
ncbi:sigma-54 interaction domain-containing protein [Chitinolyticbacter albus]|uniref:sigma-54 interaction domain-containing protein n=1 Tax=Chitinolyticbacter albus TaxID=2961951 RepID=UPI00210CDE27|nr:sigma-54 dependent transcriptional regulator [Chitinolyticbacter albus]